MRSAPTRERAVAFAFIISELVIDILKPPLHKLPCLEDDAGATLAVERHHGFPNGRALQPLADCPAGRSLFALQHEGKQFIGECGIVAERKGFEFSPVHSLVLSLSWPPH
jgi:hypothetical protein